ncbi:MAG: MBL fold metallo-hydrolase, partial [Gaiellales bacterium]
PLSPAASLPLALAARALGGYLVAVARLGAWLDSAAGSVVLGLLAIPLALVARRRRGVVALGCTVAAIGVGALGVHGVLGGATIGRTAPTALRVRFLDVGQGNATLIEAPGLRVLVDAGPVDAHVAARLATLGVDRLDALVLSHPQADHIGGAAELIDRLDVARVLDPGLITDEQFERAALVAARRRGVPVVIARAGLTLRVGDVSLRVLGPRHVVQGEDPNRGAVIVVVAQGTCRVLLPADAESDVELPLDPPRVQVLEVAHHGSDDPDLPALLRSVRPALAVISVGAGNSYGHPAPSTLATLAAAHVPVRRTDRDGDIETACPG